MKHIYIQAITYALMVSGYAHADQEINMDIPAIPCVEETSFVSKGKNEFLEDIETIKSNTQFLINATEETNDKIQCAVAAIVAHPEVIKQISKELQDLKARLASQEELVNQNKELEAKYKNAMELLKAIQASEKKLTQANTALMNEVLEYRKQLAEAKGIAAASQQLTQAIFWQGVGKTIATITIGVPIIAGIIYKCGRGSFGGFQ